MTYAADTSLTATLKVTVKEAEPVDTVPPVISGADDVAVEFGASFDPMAGVKAVDDVDGDVTGAVKVSGDTVDTSCVLSSCYRPVWREFSFRKSGRF